MRKARADKEAELSRLRQRREHIRDLGGLADRVKAFCAKVAGRLRTFDFDLKRLQSQALQVKIVVGKSGAQFQGAIPTNLATIEQTSGCLFNRDQRPNRLPLGVTAPLTKSRLT